jgi:hypothetical protein
VGVGNTMDSYGDKFLNAPSETDSKRDPQAKNGYNRPSKDESPSNFNSIGSYDPYSSNKRLSEKIGVILDDVDKIKEGDNTEVIKQKVNQGGSQK